MASKSHSSLSSQPSKQRPQRQFSLRAPVSGGHRGGRRKGHAAKASAFMFEARTPRDCHLKAYCTDGGQRECSVERRCVGANKVDRGGLGLVCQWWSRFLGGQTDPPSFSSPPGGLLGRSGHGAAGVVFAMVCLSVRPRTSSLSSSSAAQTVVVSFVGSSFSL